MDPIDTEIQQLQLQIQYAQMNIANINQQIYWANWNLQQPGINQDQINFYNSQIQNHNDQINFYVNQISSCQARISDLGQANSVMQTITNEQIAAKAQRTTLLNDLTQAINQIMQDIARNRSMVG